MMQDISYVVQSLWWAGGLQRTLEKRVHCVSKHGGTGTTVSLLQHCLSPNSFIFSEKPTSNTQEEAKRGPQAHSHLWSSTSWKNRSALDYQPPRAGAQYLVWCSIKALNHNGATGMLLDLPLSGSPQDLCGVKPFPPVAASPGETPEH